MLQQRIDWLHHPGVSQRNMRHALLGRWMATQVIRVGYYWPTLKIDHVNFVKKMQSMSKTWKLDPSTSRGAIFPYSLVAFYYLGNGYPWRFPHGLWANEILVSSYWLLHQVSRGQTFGNNYCSEYPEIPLEKYHHTLWHSMCHDNR